MPSQPARLGVRDRPPEFEYETVREPELFEIRCVDGLSEVHGVLLVLAQFVNLGG